MEDNKDLIRAKMLEQSDRMVRQARNACIVAGVALAISLIGLVIRLAC